MKDKTRLYEIDWLRVIAILILLYFHTGMIFVSWEWHIKDPVTESSPVLEHIMTWLHQWRMPLLLFISGAGTYFALGFRSSGQYLKERHQRLLIPLVFGMLVVVPPQIYYEKILQYPSYAEFYPTIFDLVPYPEGNTSWHHLWFILYLLMYSVIGLPLFRYLRSEDSARLRDRMAGVFVHRGAFSLLLIPSIISQVVLRPFFPEDTHALVDDWAGFSLYFLYFLGGYVLCCDWRMWRSVREQTAVHVTLALVALIPFYAGYHGALGFLGESGRYVVYGTSKLMIGWFTVLAAVGLGQRYLAFNKPFLKHANEAVYPFYVLHQTAIVVLGYYIIQWPLGQWTKFLLVSTAAGLASVLIYVLLIRPFRLTRFLFGMKPLRKESAVARNIGSCDVEAGMELAGE